VAQACFQPPLLSVYESNQGPMYQEFVGTVIRWTPTDEVVVLTVAHGVVGAKSIFGRCGNGQIYKFDIIKVDEDLDIAALRPPGP
jgi:S1-C subfamily serine protease